MLKNNEADINPNLSSGDELLNVSPNDNDELVIEDVSGRQISESEFLNMESASQNEVVDATENSAETNEEISTQSELTDCNETEDADDENLNDEFNQNDDEMNRKRAKGLIIVLSIVGIILLLLLGGCVWMYFAKIKPVLEAPKEVVQVHDTVVVEKEVVRFIADTTPVDTVVPVPQYVEQRIAGKNKVPTSGWLIGYKATPSEVEAIKVVAELSYVDSIPCGYYWINDAREGKKMFKVYVGPYSSQSEVNAIFPMIKARVADAHIYSEDASLMEVYRQQKQVYTAEIAK